MELTILFPYWSGKTCDLDKSIFAPDFSNSPDKFIWAHPCSAMVGRAIALRWPLFSVGRDGAARRLYQLYLCWRNNTQTSAPRRTTKTMPTTTRKILEPRSVFFSKPVVLNSGLAPVP